MKLKNLRLFGGRGIRSFSFWLTLGFWFYSYSKAGMNAQVLMILSNPLLLTLFLLGVVWRYGPFPELSVFVMGDPYVEAVFHLLTMYAYGRLLDWRVFRKRPYQ